MPVIDPSGFQISVFINTPDGARIPLWMKQPSSLSADALGAVDSALSAFDQASGGAFSGPSAGFSLLDLDLPIVESVDIEIGKGLMPKVTAQLAAPFELGIRLLESPLFLVGNTIEVQLGYPRLNRFTPWVTAFTQKPSLRITPDEGLTATINADGGGFASLRGTSGKVFEGMSYRDIIQEIADAHGWLAEFPEKKTSALASAVAAIVDVRAEAESGLVGSKEPELDKIRSVVSQGNDNDWYMIQRLARSASCDAFLGPNEDGKQTLFVKGRKEQFEGVPRIRLLMRGNPDFDTTFPILTFDTEAEGVWMPGAAFEVVCQDIDPETGAIDPVEASADTTQEPALNADGAPTDADQKIEGEKVQLARVAGSQRTGEFIVCSIRDPRTPQQVIQAHRDESSLRGGINLRISSYLVPEILPGDNVEVAGVGVFNSNYTIDALTWSASNTLEAKYTLLNNATALIDKHYTKKSKSTNTEQIEKQASVSEGVAGITVESVVSR